MRLDLALGLDQHPVQRRWETQRDLNGISRLHLFLSCLSSSSACTGRSWCPAYVPGGAAAPHAHWFTANATNSLGCAVLVVTSWKRSMHQMMELFLLPAGTIVFSAELAARFLLHLLLTFPPLCLLFKYFTDVVLLWLSSPAHFQQFC